MEPGRALAIAGQLLAGLAHAHRQEIIHRDIKPANVVLTEATGTGDHVRILDFGLAKLRDVVPAADATGAVVVGTPSYMSPEQASGGKVDLRADLYSTGVLLFELLTGRKPFESDQAHEVIAMHRERPPPSLREALPAAGLSAELDAVIARALAKDPAERWQSAGDMAAALAECPEAQRRAGGAAGADRRAAPARLRRALWLLVPVALAAGAGWWLLARARRPAAVAGAPGDAARARRRGRAAARRRRRGADATAGAVATAVAPPAADGGALPAALVPSERRRRRRPPAADAARSAGDAARPTGDAGAPADAAPADEGDAGGEGEPVAAVEADAVREDEIDAPEPAETEPARPVESVKDVQALIAAGEREQAISGLHKLRRANPKS